MDKPHEYLAELLKQRRILKDILKNADPASGVSFMIRRGVARDDEDVPNDFKARPWATVQTPDLVLASSAMAHLLKANKESILVFIRSARLDIEFAIKSIDAANVELDAEK